MVAVGEHGKLKRESFCVFCMNQKGIIIKGPTHA